MSGYQETLTRLSTMLRGFIMTQDMFSKNVTRQMMTSLKNGAIAKRRDLTEEEMMEVYVREVKQYSEALEAAEKSERPELIHKAESELIRAKTFLPPALNEDAVRDMINSITHEVLATKMKDMPKVMQALMPRIKGRFDGKRAKELVEEVLDIQEVV